MKLFCTALATLALASVSAAAAEPNAAAPPAARDWKRIAFISHSLTDGGTWPYLLRQALAEANRPEPYLINASGAGDNAADCHRRFDWAVLRFKPDLAIFYIWPNNGPKTMTADAYREAMEDMITKVQAQGAAVMLVLGYMHAPGRMQPADMTNKAAVDAVAKAQLAAVAADNDPNRPKTGRLRGDDILRELAAKHHCMTCDVRPAMARSFAAGKWLWEADRTHFSFDGYWAVARAVMDALGHPDIPVPQKLKMRVVPGLVTTWKFRPAPKGEPALDANAVRRLKPDDKWTAYTVPETKPIGVWWQDEAREEGYAVSMEKVLGKAERYIGVAAWHADKAGKAYVNTGGNMWSVWLNGERVFKSDAWNGWHPGTMRIEVDLKAGDTQIVIETGNQFILNITPNLLW